MNEQFDVSPLISETEQRELPSLTTAYINAGGRGTRLASVVEQNPATLPHSSETGVTKALIPIGEETIIDYQVRQLRELGFHTIIIGAGDHTNIKDHFDADEATPPNLEVVLTPQQEGTGGDLIKAIREAKDLGQYILVQNCDTLIEADLSEILTAHQAKQAEATIVVTERQNVPNANAFYIDAQGKVLRTNEAKQQTRPEPAESEVAYRASSTGMVILNRDLIKDYDWQSGDQPLSLYSDIIPTLVAEGRLHAYSIDENFFIDIGTEKNLAKIQRHPSITKILEHRNLKKE